jgi:hypothetical protein
LGVVDLIYLRPLLEAGDSDQNYEFDQNDLVLTLMGAKYVTGMPANWAEGDWDGAPGGQPGAPPPGDGLFDQSDIIAALGNGLYQFGPYAEGGAPAPLPPPLAPGGIPGDAQTSIVYDAITGELLIDPPLGEELTSINLISASGILTGSPALNLGGSFDIDSDTKLFKATFGAGFGSITFGAVVQPILAESFILSDLRVNGSLAVGGGLGIVDLVYLGEPTPTPTLTETPTDTSTHTATPTETPTETLTPTHTMNGGTPIPTAPNPLADIDGSGFIDVHDLLELLRNWHHRVSP